MIVGVSTLCRLVFPGFNTLCYDVQLICVIIYFERRSCANPVFILLLKINLTFSIKKTLLLQRWEETVAARCLNVVNVANLAV